MEFIYFIFDEINGIKFVIPTFNTSTFYSYDISIVLSFGLFISIANGTGKL